MNKKLLMIGGGVVLLGSMAWFTGKRGGEKAPDDAPQAVTKEVSDEERRKIAAEWGRKGAAKSAEIRRAKKAAREAAKLAPAPDAVA